MARAGAKGQRLYDWAFLCLDHDRPAPADQAGRHWLMVRRRRATGELAYYRCYTPRPVPPHQLLAGTSADRPVVAVQVRASVGRPGGSAHARWQRLRVAEWAAWTRTLPWRAGVILGIGAGGAVLGRLLVPRLGLVVGALAAVAASWGLRFRPSRDAVAWRRGAVGSDALLGCSAPWSGMDGRSCTTWPSPAARPSSTTW